MNPSLGITSFPIIWWLLVGLDCNHIMSHFQLTTVPFIMTSFRLFSFGLFFVLIIEIGPCHDVDLLSFVFSTLSSNLSSSRRKIDTSYLILISNSSGPYITKTQSSAYLTYLYIFPLDAVAGIIIRSLSFTLIV